MDHDITDRSEEQLIAAYLVRKSVTQCPPRIPRGAPQSGRFNPNASSQLAEGAGVEVRLRPARETSKPPQRRPRG